MPEELMAGRKSRRAGEGRRLSQVGSRRETRERRSAMVASVLRTVGPPSLAFFLCVVALGAAVAGVFKVRHVDVLGVPAGALQDEVVHSSGVLGTNVFTVQSDAVVRRLTRLRQVIVTRVDTSFPNQVTIHARVRIPVVAWQDGPSLFEVDAGGVIVNQVSRTALPVLVGVTHSDTLDPSLVMALRITGQQLAGAPDGAVARFTLSPTTGLNIIGRSGWTAIIGRGSPQTMANRIATLRQVLVTLGPRAARLTLVDLRFKSPYLRLAGSS